MPSTLGTTVTANYLKTKPSTRFSTRDIAFLVIDMDSSGYFNNYLEPNSNFSKVVRLVQTQAEVYGVGEPASGVVTIMIAIDTAANGEDGEVLDVMNAHATTIYQALHNAGINVDTVSFKRLQGGGFATQNMLDYNRDSSTVI